MGPSQDLACNRWSWECSAPPKSGGTADQVLNTRQRRCKRPFFLQDLIGAVLSDWGGARYTRHVLGSSL